MESRWGAKLLSHASANETSGNFLLAARPGEWMGLKFLATVVGLTITEWTWSMYPSSVALHISLYVLYRLPIQEILFNGARVGSSHTGGYSVLSCWFCATQFLQITARY